MKFLMIKRRGVSLLNVMVFMVFAVMLTAQVFFFAKNAADDVADEREMMMYRMNLDSLVDDAKVELRDDSSITHKETLEEETVDYTNFYEKTKMWTTPKTVTTGGITYNLMIHDLSYKYNYSASFNRTDWENQIGKNGESMYKKVFAAMPFIPKKEIKTDDEGKPITDAEGKPGYEYTDNVVYNSQYRYYLIRAWVQLPENFYGRTLMYQVLVRRKEDSHTDLKVRSFQEVWF